MQTSAVMVRPVAEGEMADWEVSDELWAQIKPLLPVVERRSRYPGRRRLDDRACLNGILFVLVTGMRWDRLPPQLRYGSGVTCWRRLRDWTTAGVQSGVWDRLHELLLAELHAAGRIDWSRAAADGSHVRAKRGTPRSDQARSTAAARAASTTPSSMAPACPSRSP
jgi:transposase